MSDPPVVPRPAASGDGSAFTDRVRSLRGDARVGIAVLACVAVAAGVAWFRAGIAPTAPVPSASAGGSPSNRSTPDTTTTAPVTTSTTGAIVVDVVGAVLRPGVVTLPAAARVLDAIHAAGGATAGADLVRLNLAAKLSDGARVAVPIVGEAPPAIDPSAVSGAAGPTGDGATAANGEPGAPVNVNSASEAQLEALPGIGPTLAAAIVQERERNGPFRSADDLTRVHGIGPGRLAQLRDFVAF
jgi:competence protein ComEA